MKRMMMLAMPFAFGSVLSLLLWDHNPTIALAGLIISVAIYKSLYWVPYHVDFTKFTDKKTRGRQISILLAVTSTLGIITPFVGGWIIATAGFNSLFLISLGILLTAIAPLFFINKVEEHYSYGFFETFKELFSKKNRPLFLGYFGDGAQSIVTVIIWPIFIFLLLKGEFLIVGLVSSITVFMIVAIRFLIGDLIDRWDKKRILVIGSILNTTGWIIKLFIETTFQVFLFDTYHKMGRAVNRISVDATTYDAAADNGHYVDEFTVLKEISLHFGRIFMLILIGVVVLYFNLKVAFILAAVASLFVTLLNRQVALKQ
jgi:YQGE family putative transporter